MTAGIAGPASIGVPVTDRRHAPGVALVTGHAKEGAAGPDWQALARSGLTLVIYMGVAAVESVQKGLLQSLPATTCAAVVQSVSLPAQREAVCTLASLATTVHDEGLASPSIIIVGDVLRGVQSLARSAMRDRAA